MKDTKKKHNQEISALKDELDLLNDKLVQASKAGSTLEMYKKRLEEMQVLKKKVADLTD